MKALAVSLAIFLLASSAFADRRITVDIDIDIDADDKARPAKTAAKPLPDVNVNLVAIAGKDFIDPPTVDQVFSALRDSPGFLGIGWEVVIKRFGMGGNYLVLFEPDSNDSWWFSWETQPFYASCHLLGGSARIDPFVDAGLGCAGRVYLGPTYASGELLGISIYPFASAGLALNIDSFRIGAKISAIPWQGRLPATPIAGCEVGAFQAQLFAGVSLGNHR